MDLQAIDQGEVSDGYHTFNELYRYRMLYNALAVIGMADRCVKSWRHSDGELCFGGGWFVVVMELPNGQVSNHYEAQYWDMFRCAEVEEAPEWDGHTPEEAANRLQSFLDNGLLKDGETVKENQYYRLSGGKLVEVND